MTAAPSYMVDMLFWVLLLSSLLYDRPWRRERGASPDDPSFVFAWRFIEALLVIGLLVVLGSYVVVVVGVWAIPEGQRPAPAWRYLELAFVVGWVGILCIRTLRRWLPR